MKIERQYDDLAKNLKKGKVLAIYGARQIGKTTLLKTFLKSTKLKHRFVTGDDVAIRELLGSERLSTLEEFCAGYDLIAIDEAQHIPNIGIGLKLMVDHIEDIQIIATGSSSFDLANKIGEPLVGRKRTLKMYPLSFLELNNHFSKYDLNEMMPELLIYGSYPEVFTETNKAQKIQLLSELVGSYLLKDILALERVKSPVLLLHLLKLLAFQLGSEVSLNELSNQLNIDIKTVARYLDLLEKSFIIYPLGGFSKNLRSEVTQKNKYYFNDLGIRNAIIQNFNRLDLRNDVGALWENFVMMERLKFRTYTNFGANKYFWRSYQSKEIDLIEEYNGELHATEFKWRNTKKRFPKKWIETYPKAINQYIDQKNYLDFILPKNAK